MMMDQRTLQDPDALARRLVQRAHNRDGLPEIGIGVTFLAVAVLNSSRLAPVLALLIPGFCFGLPSVLKWIRRRYLLPRFGYVESFARRKRSIGPLQAAVVLAVALSVVAGIFFELEAWPIALTGILGGGILILAGQLPRFVAGGVLMAVFGVLLAFANVSLERGFALLFGAAGLAAILSGTYSFLRFLRQVESR